MFSSRFLTRSIARMGQQQQRAFGSRAIAKEIRKNRVEVETNAPSSVSPATVALSLLAGVAGTGAFLTYSEQGRSIVNQVEPLKNAMNAIEEFVHENINERVIAKVQEERKGSFLPDQRGPERPTVLLDFGGTLVHYEWSRKHGWRCMKRPGLNLFLQRLCESYEVVLFSSESFNNTITFLENDEMGQYFELKLYGEAMAYKDNKYFKDLSSINRDLSRVILIDDDEANYADQPHNGIKISKFDGTNMNDTALMDLLPFLQETAMRGTDVREEIKKFEGKDIGTEYKKREQETWSKLLKQKKN